MQADWSLVNLVSLAAMWAAVILLATWANRRLDLTRIDLRVGAATVAARVAIRPAIVVATWAIVFYSAGILRVLLLRI